MQDWYEKKTLGAFLDEAAARWSAREALTFASQRWSFAHLRRVFSTVYQQTVGGRKNIYNPLNLKVPEV